MSFFTELYIEEITKLQFNAEHRVSHFSAKFLTRLSGRMDWCTMRLTDYQWEDELQKTLLVFWSLAANTKPLKFCKESFYFLLREQKDTGCCRRQMSDSDVRIVFYTSLYRGKKGMGPMKEEQLTTLLGSLCSSRKMLPELCLSECS